MVAGWPGRRVLEARVVVAPMMTGRTLEGDPPLMAAGLMPVMPTEMPD